jgi:hypothetical protein
MMVAQLSTFISPEEPVAAKCMVCGQLNSPSADAVSVLSLLLHPAIRIQPARAMLSSAVRKERFFMDFLSL